MCYIIACQKIKNPVKKIMDPDRNPDRHPNFVPWATSHNISVPKSVHNFLSFLADKQTRLKTFSCVLPSQARK